MATLKLTIFKAKVLKDGRHKVRIAVCHKQETCYIVTQFIIDNLSQFKNGQVVKRPDAAIINTKLRNLLNKYQEKLDAIERQAMYSCTQLKEFITRSQIEKQKETFQSICKSYIDELQKNGKNNYASMLNKSQAHFLKFLKGDIALADITPELIERYAEHIDKKKWSKATVGISMRNVRTIINRAIKKRKVSYEVHPFIDYSIPQPPVRDVSIKLESLNKILNAGVDSRCQLVARDIFSLSFYLGGINMIDLLSIDFSDMDYIKYERKKIKDRTVCENVIILPIHKNAKIIIKRWLNTKTEKLDFKYNFTYKNFTRHIARNIVALAKELGIKERVVYYSARKTFAQLAFELGIPDGVIDYCLGHSDKSKGVIRFYTKVKQRQAEIAINRVIDYVNNPDKYKDYIEMKADIMMMKG
ncbi:MAG: site-specific integrase [Bacteroides sp.]